MDHSMMIWTETDEIFWRVVLFVGIDVMDINDFVEATDNTFFCSFFISLKVNLIRFSLIICFIFVKMKYIVITTSTEAFGMKNHFSFTSFAGCYFWLPFKFFVTSVTKSFSMMLFLLITINTFFYHLKEKGVRILKTLCKRLILVRFSMEERHTIYIMRTFGKIRIISADYANRV